MLSKCVRMRHFFYSSAILQNFHYSILHSVPTSLKEFCFLFHAFLDLSPYKQSSGTPAKRRTRMHNVKEIECGSFESLCFVNLLCRVNVIKVYFKFCWYLTKRYLADAIQWIHVKYISVLELWWSVI